MSIQHTPEEGGKGSYEPKADCDSYPRFDVIQHDLPDAVRQFCVTGESGCALETVKNLET